MALHYLGKDPNSENPEDIKAAVDMMKAVRGDVKRFSSSGYIDDMAAGNLCAAIGYGGDLNIAKTRAEEAANGVEIKVLTPKTGVGVWVDSFMIPRDAQTSPTPTAISTTRSGPRWRRKTAASLPTRPPAVPRAS